MFDETIIIIEQLEKQLETSKQKAKELGDALQSAAGVKTQSAIKKTETELENAQRKLDDLSTKATISGQKMNSNMRGYRKEVVSANKAVNGLGKRISRLAMGALVFSAITKVFTELRETIGSMLLSNDEFRQSVNMLKASLWTMSQPLYEAVLPALKTFVYWLTKGILYVAAFFSAMGGKTLEQTIASAKALNTQANAFEDLTKSSKKAEKQLASFDDISILREGAVVSDLGGVNSAFEDLKSLLNDSDFQNLKDFETWVSENKDSIKTALEVAGLGALGLAIGKTISNIGSLLGWFKKKDAGLDTQTRKTQFETEAVTALSGALALVPAAIAGLIPAFDRLTKSGVETIPALNGVEDVAKDLLPAFADAKEGVEQITPALEGVAGSVEDFQTTVEPVTEQVGESITTMAETTETSFTTLFEGLVTKASNTMTEIAKIFGLGGLKIETGLQPGLDNIESNVDIFADHTDLTLKGWAKNAAQNGVDTASVFANNMYESFKTTDSNTGAFSKSSSEGIKKWAENVTTNVDKAGYDMAAKYASYLSVMFQNEEQFRAKLGLPSNGLVFKPILPKKNTSKTSFAAIGAIAAAALTMFTGVPIPALAKGGIVPHATTALIGERGKEAVLPLENNTDWMDELADRISARNNTSGNTTVVLEIDGREFGHAVLEQGQRESRRLGTRLVMA